MRDHFADIAFAGPRPATWRAARASGSAGGSTRAGYGELVNPSTLWRARRQRHHSDTLCPACGLRVGSVRYHLILEMCQCPRTPPPRVDTWWNTLHFGWTFQWFGWYALVAFLLLVAAYFIH
jgi:hypothetical protein